MPIKKPDDDGTDIPQRFIDDFLSVVEKEIAQDGVAIRLSLKTNLLSCGPLVDEGSLIGILTTIGERYGLDFSEMVEFATGMEDIYSEEAKDSYINELAAEGQISLEHLTEEQKDEIFEQEVADIIWEAATWMSDLKNLAETLWGMACDVTEEAIFANEQAGAMEGPSQRDTIKRVKGKDGKDEFVDIYLLKGTKFTEYLCQVAASRNVSMESYHRILENLSEVGLAISEINKVLFSHECKEIDIKDEDIIDNCKLIFDLMHHVLSEYPFIGSPKEKVYNEIELNPNNLKEIKFYNDLIISTGIMNIAMSRLISLASQGVINKEKPDFAEMFPMIEIVFAMLHEIMVTTGKELYDLQKD